MRRRSLDSIDPLLARIMEINYSTAAGVGGRAFAIQSRGLRFLGILFSLSILMLWQASLENPANCGGGTGKIWEDLKGLRSFCTK